jgi:hypothetical protein
VYNAINTLPNEEQVRVFQRSLASTRDLAAADLQKSVFKNYSEFVVVSKEIGKLEADMLALRGCLSELRAVQKPLAKYGGAVTTLAADVDTVGGYLFLVPYCAR